MGRFGRLAAWAPVLLGAPAVAAVAVTVLVAATATGAAAPESGVADGVTTNDGASGTAARPAD
ncbi:MAG TPA: hypothetical protein VIS06_11430, partial [Mycobacteriales bacterium]